MVDKKMTRDTNGVIRSRKYTNDLKENDFTDTNGLMRSRKYTNGLLENDYADTNAVILPHWYLYSHFLISQSCIYDF
jgi:hypothetical protein